MANNVVFTSDLSLYKADNVLWMIANGDQLTQYPANPSDDFEVELEVEIKSQTGTYRILQHQVSNRGWYIATDSTGFYMRNQNAGGSQNIDISIPVGKYSVVCGMRPRDGGGTPEQKTMYFSYNGGVEQTLSVTVNVSIPTDIMVIGYNPDTQIKRIKMSGYHTFEYDVSLDEFGSSTLTDQSGSGNDLTIPDVDSWWKEGIDEVWDDWELYYNQLPVTPVEFQNCTRIDVYSPDTDDPLWGNYNSTWLVVNDQSMATYKLSSNSISNRLALEL